MTATDLSRNAHVLVLQELRSRFTESGSPSRTAALEAAISALATHQPVAQEPAAFVEHFTDRLSTLNLTNAGLELGIGKHALYAVPLAQTVDLGQFRVLAGKFDGMGDEEVGDAYSGPYYECARQLRALIDSQAVRK